MSKQIEVTRPVVAAALSGSPESIASIAERITGQKVKSGNPYYESVRRFLKELVDEGEVAESVLKGRKVYNFFDAPKDDPADRVQAVLAEQTEKPKKSRTIPSCKVRPYIDLDVDEDGLTPDGVKYDDVFFLCPGCGAFIKGIRNGRGRNGQRRLASHSLVVRPMSAPPEGDGYYRHVADATWEYVSIAPVTEADKPADKPAEAPAKATAKATADRPAKAKKTKTTKKAAAAA